MLRVSLSISGLQNVPGVQAGGPHWLYHRVLPTTQREEGGEREREERERERRERRERWMDGKYKGEVVDICNLKPNISIPAELRS